MSVNLPNDWSRIKKKWKSKNPPDKDGNYPCWICTRPVHESKVTLDHVAPLEQYPEYARELSNLRPAHRWCNEERARKGASLIRRFGHTRKRRK